MSYRNEAVVTGPNAILDVNLAPAYIVAELESLTFLRDEDPGVDEVQVATLAELGEWRLPFRWPYAEADLAACAAWVEANGGDELQPHIPMFAAREDAMPGEALFLSVTGTDGDQIPGEWLFLMDLVETAAQIVGTALEQPYIDAAASALDSFVDWMSTPETLGTIQWGAAPPWVVSDLPFEMNKIRANWRIMRLQPTPGRQLNVILRNVHIHDDGDSWPRGKGDIVIFTRVCDGLGCKVLQFGRREFDDGDIWAINQRIFRSDEQRGAGPYLYIEVIAWDDDSCLENWDMLGIGSTLLTEEDRYGIGIPIVFHDSGYDEGEVTIELEVTED